MSSSIDHITGTKQTNVLNVRIEWLIEWIAVKWAMITHFKKSLWLIEWVSDLKQKPHSLSLGNLNGFIVKIKIDKRMWF